MDVYSRKKTILIRGKWLHVTEELRENWGQKAETYLLNLNECELSKSR
jgi:hypothetical protein